MTKEIDVLLHMYFDHRSQATEHRASLMIANSVTVCFSDKGGDALGGQRSQLAAPTPRSILNRDFWARQLSHFELLEVVM